MAVLSLSVLSLFPLLPCPCPSPCSFIPPSPYLISRMTICDLYTMPRVAEPVWLTMMSGASEKNQLCGHFMRELSLLMEQASKNQLSDCLCSHLGRHQSRHFLSKRGSWKYVKSHFQTHITYWFLRVVGHSKPTCCEDQAVHHSIDLF